MRRSVVGVYRVGLPEREASDSPCRRSRAKRLRHLHTRAGRVFISSATATLLWPSARRSIIPARSAMRRSVVPDRTHDSNTERSSRLKTTAALFAISSSPLGVVSTAMETIIHITLSYATRY